MAPIQQDSLDIFLNSDFQLLDETVTAAEFGINFDDIASQAQSFPWYDNTKLLEDNNVKLDLPAPPCAITVSMEPASPSVNLAVPAAVAKGPAVVVEPIIPDPSADLIQVQDLQPISPEMFLMQPVSPGNLQPPSVTSIGTAMSPCSTQALSPDPEPEYLQPEPETVTFTSNQDQYDVVWASDMMQSIQVPTAAGEPVLSPLAVEVEEDGSLAPSPVTEPKKRGRKRKYPEGTTPPRRGRPKKTKVYEMQPLQDEVAEKKRKNAVNAKLHRDKQKNERENLAQQLKVVTDERDNLKKQVEELKRIEAKLRQKIAEGFILL